MVAVRPVDELISVDDPAWPSLRGMLTTAAVPVTVLPVDPMRAREVLFRLQATAYSTLGALALHTGGLVVDQGWLRILGGGHEGFADLAAMNRIGEPGAGPGALTVAVDVLGGQFAVNGGALPGKSGEVCFFGADTLAWEPIGGGHSAFVAWAVGGGLADFYAGVRWPGWAEEVEQLSADTGLLSYPPLWSAEGRADTAACSRRQCPIAELVTLHIDTAEQLGN